MSEEALKIISDAMSEIGLNYQFMEWNSKPAYPYFTGEYQETEPMNEDAVQVGIMFIAELIHAGTKTQYIALQI